MQAPDDISISEYSTYQIDIDSIMLRPDFPFNTNGTTYHLTNGASDDINSLEPVTLDLTSIDMALTTDFWHSSQSEEICFGINISDALSSWRRNIKLALQSYGADSHGSVPHGNCFVKNPWNQIVRKLFFWITTCCSCEDKLGGKFLSK